MRQRHGTGEFAALDAYIVSLQDEAIQALATQIDVRDRLESVIRAAVKANGGDPTSRSKWGRV
jgi:hypothetical protein